MHVPGILCLQGGPSLRAGAADENANPWASPPHHYLCGDHRGAVRADRAPQRSFAAGTGYTHLLHDNRAKYKLNMHHYETKYENHGDA